MANQNASGTLMQASANLAASQAPADLATAFSSGFGMVVTEVEKENQKIQDEVNQFMGNLKTDIDFTTLDPEMEKAMRGYLVTAKNEYADLANTIARLDDASSPEYQKAVDRMNDIQREFSTLSAESSAYVQNRVTNADLLKGGAFSKGADPKLTGTVASVYGLAGDKAKPSVVNGKLVFNVGGEEVKYADLQNIPGQATELADAILSKQAELSTQGRLLSPQERDYMGSQMTAAFKDPNALASILTDYEKQFPYSTTKEKFFNLRSEGKLDTAALQEISNEVIESIMTGYDEASAYGKQQNDAELARKAELAKGKVNIDPPTPAQIAREEEKKKIFSQVDEGYEKPIPTGRKNSKQTDLYITLDKESGEWVLTDAAGRFEKGYGGNIVTFKTAEEAKKYIK
jgi:hypothetical protein